MASQRDASDGTPPPERTASVQRLAEIVSLASGNLWLVDGEHVTLAISEGAARLMGHEPQELIGRPTLPLNVVPAEAERHRLALALEGAHEGQATVTGKHGRPVRLSYQARRLLIDGEAVVLGVVEPVEGLHAVASMSDVLREFKQQGVPQGYWLLRIEQGEHALGTLSSLLHDLHNAVMDDVADEPFAR